MNEYFALIIPVIFAILLIVFFHTKVTWWEMVLPVFVGLIVIFTMKGCDKSMNVQDTEYLSQHVVKAVYEQTWNEWIKKTCSERYACGTETYSTGSGKNRRTSTRTKYCTRYYDCSYCKTHPAMWYLVDDAGQTFDITQQRYEELVKQWGNQTFVDMKRHYYTVDGNEYVTNWNNEKNTLITTHREHSYENRIQCSSTIYNFKELSDSDKVHYNIFEYPKIIGYSQNPVMTYNYSVQQQTQEYVNTINGLLGEKKQVQYFVCVWKNKPYSVSDWQQAYWKGGNKNEIIVCIGVDALNKVTWANVFTWSEKDIVRIKIRDYVLGNKGKVLNLNELTDFSYTVIDKNWKRKNFHDFDFLEVELTDTQVNWIYIVVILFSLGLSVFAVMNQVDPEYQDGDSKLSVWTKTKYKTLSYKTTNNYRKFKQFIKTKIENANRFIKKVFRKR
jgi:hypothetical protein